MDEWFPGVRSELAAHVPQIEQQLRWKVSVENYSECYHCTLVWMNEIPECVQRRPQIEQLRPLEWVEIPERCRSRIIQNAITAR